MTLFRVLDTPLSVAEATAAVSAPDIGGIDLFLGAVRDHNAGRAVTRLEYHAYVSMAEKEMRRIAEEIAGELPGVRLAALHRIGSLAVGDLAVVCAAGAVHRGEAFQACRALIDRIKHRVPIWKREHGRDGPYWVGWEDARCGDGHEHAHEQ
jgi:molybdopterin synthase catalytic subunit